MALQPSLINDCYRRLSQPERESCVNTARQPFREINCHYPKRYTDSLRILNIHPLTYQQGRKKYVLPTYQHSRPTSESLSLKRPDICHSGARVAHLPLAQGRRHCPSAALITLPRELDVRTMARAGTQPRNRNTGGTPSPHAVTS